MKSAKHFGCKCLADWSGLMGTMLVKNTIVPYTQSILPHRRMFSGQSLPVQLKGKLFWAIQLSKRELHQASPCGEDAVNFTLGEAKKFLEIKQLSSVTGFTCLKIKCPNCGHVSVEDEVSPEKHLYINEQTGHCLCPYCKLHGPWAKLEAFLNCTPGSVELSSYFRPITSSTQSLKLDKIFEMSQPLNSDNFPKFKTDLSRISIETLIRAEARTIAGSQSLLIPVKHPDGTLVSFWKLLCDSETGAPETFVPLILGKRTGKEGAVITHSVKDALFAFQNLGNTVICLPAGLNFLPQETLPYLESFKKLVIWFGGGVHEWESARTFARKLVDKRCHFIRPSPSTPSPSLASAGDLSLPDIFKSNKPMFHEAVTTFSSLRDEVYSEILQKDEISGVKWKRFAKLNDYLQGFRRGEITVFTGPTGAGKTTFMSEYSLDLCEQKVNTLWGSFEIKNVRLAKMMLTQFAGVSLEANIESFPAFATEFEKLPLFFLTFHGQQDLKSVMHAINHATYVHDVGHVIVDNLQFMMGTGSGSSVTLDMIAKQDQILGEFRQFASDKNVHVTLVIHPRKENVSEELTTASIYGSAKATQEADNVLILQDVKVPGPNSRKKYLQIAKNRFSGDLGIMPLVFNKENLSFQPKKKSGKIAWSEEESN